MRSARLRVNQASFYNGFDLSHASALRPLASLARAFRVAGDTPFFLVGAYARDLLLLHGRRVDTSTRPTSDVDFAVEVGSWQHYDSLRARLISSGHFAAVPAVPPLMNKLQYLPRAIGVDLLPFGGVERRDRTIAWPSGAVVMNAFGLREAQAWRLTVALPDAAELQLASLPSLMMLKLVTWLERRVEEPGKDAHDMRLIFGCYADRVRAMRRLRCPPGFGEHTAGAWLLGRDLARLLDARGRERVATMLAVQAHGSELIHDLAAFETVGDRDARRCRVRQLVSAFERGFSEPAERRRAAARAAARGLRGEVKREVDMQTAEAREQRVAKVIAEAPRPAGDE